MRGTGKRKRKRDRESSESRETESECLDFEINMTRRIRNDRIRSIRYSVCTNLFAPSTSSQPASKEYREIIIFETIHVRSLRFQ